MKRTAFDESRDQRIATEADANAAQQCLADGCPNRATYFPGILSLHGAKHRCGLCSAHAFADRAAWPRITEDLQDAAIRRQNNPPPAELPPAHNLSRGQRLAILQRLRAVFDPTRQPDRLAWARKLRDRQERGDKLTPAQIDAYKAALGSAHQLAAAIGEDDLYGPGGRYAA